MDAVLTCLVSDQIGHGERAQRLVTEVADYLGLAGGLAVRDYQTAIRVAFQVMALPHGAGVALSPLTPQVFRSVAEEGGLVPRFVEVSAENGCVTADELQKLAAGTVQAVVIASPLGMVPQLEQIAALGLPIVEDATTGIGGTIGERRCGSFGRYVIVRMEDHDVITAGGGALLLASGRKELTALRQAGVPPSALLPDLNAALGLAQFSAIEQRMIRRKEIAKVYTQALSKGRHKSLLQSGDGENVWYSFPVVLSGGMKEVVQYARKRGVETTPGFRDTIAAGLDFADHSLPNARILFLRCLLFPLFPTLGKQDVVQIAKVLSTLP